MILAPSEQVGFFRFNPESNAIPETTEEISGAYYEFTLAPDPGWAFSLDATDSLQFRTRIYDTSGEAGFSVRSSRDDYATVLDSGTLDDSQSADYSLDLPGFSEIPEPVTFRIYLFDPSSTANSVAIRTGGSFGESGTLDFVINGTVEQAGEIAVTGVSVSPDSVTTLETGERVQLTIVVEPEFATDPSVSWSSGDTSVASVDENGLVTATGPGSTVITVTTTDGGFTDSASILVAEGPPSWGPFPKTGSVDVDTGTFFGWILLQDDWPYVWSLGKPVYLPETNLGESGAWFFLTP
jgi:hypothetical protein